MRTKTLRITDELLKTKSLTEILNENFEEYDNRDNYMIKKLEDLEKKIDDFRAEMKKEFKNELGGLRNEMNGKFKSTDVKLDAIMKHLGVIEKHLGIDPNLLTEED